MTLVRGRRRAFLAAFMILTVALLDGDCSYLISSATRPPRLKQQRAAVELAAAGENGSQAPAASNAYRQSAPSASSATAASNAIVARHGAYEAVKNGQTYPLARYRAAAEGLSSLERKRSHFLNALQPAARTFLLHGHHERSEGAGLRSGGSSSASSSSRNKRDRNQFERGGYPDMMEYTHGLSDVEDNIIDESPKSSKNLNYYPYRGKRPFEVPQIGECSSSQRKRIKSISWRTYT